MRVVLVLVLLVTSCASPVAPRGTLPASPGPDELRNDGSDAAKDRLLQHYGVRMADDRVEIAGATRPARSGVVGTGMDEDVNAYLGSPAVEGGALRTALGLGALGLMGASVALLFLGMPVPFAVGLGSVSAVDFLTRQLVRNPATRPGAIQLNILLSIVATLTVSLVGGLVVLPGMGLLATGALLLQQSRRMTLNALTNAAATFNTTLKDRIAAAAVVTREEQTTPAPAAPATTPPPDTQAPEVETQVHVPDVQ